MKKKLSLLMVALVAVAAFAYHQSLRRAEAVTVEVPTETELGAFITEQIAANPGAPITLKLAAGGSYTMTTDCPQLPVDAAFTITSDAANPATITWSNKPLRGGKALTIENVIIDASSGSGHIINMLAPSADIWGEGQVSGTDTYWKLDQYKFENVQVKGLVKSFFLDNAMKYYIYTDVVVNNCLIELGTGSKGVTFNFNGGPIEHLAFTNNTVYSSDKENYSNFLIPGNKRIWQAPGYESTATSTDLFENNTFYNVSNGSNKMLINTNVLKGQANAKFIFKKNIFANTSDPSKLIYKNITNAANAANQITAENNTYIILGEGDPTYWNETSLGSDEGIQDNPGFKDAANADFTLALTSAQNVAKTGDPRWFVYAVTVADGIENGSVVADLAAAKAGDVVTLTATPADGYMLDKWDVKQGETAVAVKDNKFTMPAGDVTVGATFRVAPVDVEIAATDITEGKLTDAIVAKAAGKPIKNLTVTLAENTAYTVTASIEAGGNVTITGAAGATIDASGLEGDFITLNGSTEFVKKADETDSDHYGIDAVAINGVTINGLKGALITDAQKTLVKELTVANSVVEMPAAGKNVLNFNGKGYAGKVVVKNSTIYANGNNTGFFAQYGSRPKNINGDWLQEFDVQNSTIVNIAVGKNVCDLKQNGTAQNVFTLKNNVFVNVGKSGQVVVGFNKGQTSATPVWDVDGNVFNYDGVDKSAAEVEKAGQAGDPAADIVKNSIAGVISFTDAANGDFNATLGTELAPTTEKTEVGDPRWTVTNKQVPSDIVISPADGDIAAALTAATEGKLVKNITINLTKDVTYTVGATLVAPNSITINGNGAIIDVSALEANLIEFAAKAAEDTEWTNANVSISGVTVKGLKKALFFSNSKYYYGDFSLINSVVEQAGDATTFDYTKGSVAVNFTVTCSTIYAPTATTKSLYSSQSGQKATEYKDDATQSFAFLLNTMYNLAPTKNFFTHRQNNQKWLAYGVHSNIFVNCGKSGQVIKGMNGGQSGTNPTWVISGNAFNFDGADTSAAEATGDDEEPVKESVAGIVTFTDAANGNFSGNVLLPAAATAPTGLGDPRWTITYANAPEKLYVIGDMNNWDRTALTEMTFNAETKAFEFEFAPDKFTSFAFATKQMTADEATADPNWEDFNTNYRYSIGEGDNVAELNKALALLKVNGTVQVKPVKEGTTYKISIAWDLSTVTIAGEAAPEPEPVSVDKLFVMGTGTPKGWDGTTELTFNETTQAFEYVATVTEDTYLTFGDAEFTSWDDFNGKHRFAPAEGNTDAVMDTEVQLVLVNEGCVVLKNAGTYKISVTKDLKMTITSTGTGINSIAADKMENATIYTIGGQRVEKAQKGLYIINGKKVVVK